MSYSRTDEKITELVDRRSRLLFKGGHQNRKEAELITGDIIRLATSQLGLPPPPKMIIKMDGKTYALQSYRRGKMKYVPLDEWRPTEMVWRYPSRYKIAEQRYGLDPHRK